METKHQKQPKPTPNARIKEKKQGIVSPTVPLSSVGQSPASNKPSNDMVGLFKKEVCCSICEEIVSPYQREDDSKNEHDDGQLESKAAIDDPIIKCRGGCHNNYHLSCVNENTSTRVEDWKCNECKSGKHSCFICKNVTCKETSSQPTEKCSQTGCGKYFHRSCLKNYGLWPQARYSEHALTCPGHICHTCASDNPKDPYMKYNTKLLKCIRCPTAYHSGDHCVAAGL